MKDKRLTDCELRRLARDFGADVATLDEAIAKLVGDDDPNVVHGRDLLIEQRNAAKTAADLARSGLLMTRSQRKALAEQLLAAGARIEGVKARIQGLERKEG